MPPGGETADGQKYARRLLQHKIQSIRKEYSMYVGKRTIVQYIIRRKKDSHKSTQHRGEEEHKKYKYENKSTYYRHTTRFESAHG